ncbi:hypothetical protein KCTC32516_02175 [Polaribacter huanghezhanensis]|uniref:DUF493 family protein n=1 Tax=Polaribacter huanghezhanensis TaxID=1354726 RepID=UPI0026486D6B|nr:DUF493 family protein [Polaribacter huanghezhanensis]WKD86797.1 hypothetical protein KCTC32516_02175 [Polaribacter huanghezhanensis]
MSKKEDFYLKLKDSLEATTKFPSEYLYKFIVPAKGNHFMEVEDVFKNKLIKIASKESKNGKYVSLSIRIELSSADEVISYYRKAEKIEGIISL